MLTICELADCYPVRDNKVLFIADRGFGSYNFYAHAKENGLFYLVRVKDLNIVRLLGENIPSLQNANAAADTLSMSPETAKQDEVGKTN